MGRSRCLRCSGIRNNRAARCSRGWLGFRRACAEVDVPSIGLSMGWPTARARGCRSLREVLAARATIGDGDIILPPIDERELCLRRVNRPDSHQAERLTRLGIPSPPPAVLPAWVLTRVRRVGPGDIRFGPTNWGGTDATYPAHHARAFHRPDGRSDCPETRACGDWSRGPGRRSGDRGRRAGS
jgi:hypothetical protein